MSVHADVLDWVKLQIVGTALVAESAVKIRKRPVFVKGDPATLVLVVPGDENFVTRDTGGYGTFEFPVHVVIVQQVSQAYGDPTWLVNARAIVRGAVLKPKPLDSVRMQGYNANPTLPLDGFPEGYDASPQTFIYYGSELLGV